MLSESATDNVTSTRVAIPSLSIQRARRHNAPTTTTPPGRGCGGRRGRIGRSSPPGRGCGGGGPGQGAGAGRSGGAGRGPRPRARGPDRRRPRRARPRGSTSGATGDGGAPHADRHAPSWAELTAYTIRPRPTQRVRGRAHRAVLARGVDRGGGALGRGRCAPAQRAMANSGCWVASSATTWLWSSKSTSPSPDDEDRAERLVAALEGEAGELDGPAQVVQVGRGRCSCDPPGDEGEGDEGAAVGLEHLLHGRGGLALELHDGALPEQPVGAGVRPGCAP